MEGLNMIDTHKIIEEYLNDAFDGDQEQINKIRSFVDKPEVYAYEIELGKSIFEMSVDELFGMFDTFYNKRTLGTNDLSYAALMHSISRFRQLFEYYIEHYEVIRNPFNDKRMKGKAAADRVMNSRKRFTTDDMNRAISMIRNDTDNDDTRPDYLECIILLFYNGFYNSREIVTLKENMIDIDACQIHLERTTLTVSERCMSLLVKVHETKYMNALRGVQTMRFYKDYYFPYPIKQASKTEEIDNKDDLEVVLGRRINKQLNQNVVKKFGVDIRYNKLFWIGFYDRLVAKYGEEKTDYLIQGQRIPDSIRIIAEEAAAYQIDKSADLCYNLNVAGRGC